MRKKNKVFDGAIITILMRWTDKSIGFVSTIILARVLVPEDFGIVAMAMLMVGFVDVFLNLGVNQVLIHNKDAQKEDYDTAWTVRLIQACLVGLIIFVTAPMAVHYFDEPNVADVLRVVAISVVIGGLTNIGVIMFQKEMEFGREFKMFFILRIVGFLVTLTIALIYQTYWAMVWGSVASRITGVLLSYGMHPFRPRFSLARIQAIWSFSQWVLFKNIGGYFDRSIDRLLIGNRLNADDLGGYTLAGEVSSLPTTELLAPIGRVLFPAFVEARDDPPVFASRVTLSIGVQGLVALPACVGLMFVAHDLVYVVLGAKWLFVAPLIQIMAVTNLVVAMAHSCGYALLALGKVKIQAFVAWLQALLFVAIAILFGADAVAEDFAAMRLLTTCIGSIVLIVIVVLQIRVLSINAFIRALIRPLMGAFIMAVVLYAAHPVLFGFSIFFRLLLEVSFGAVVYTMVVAVSWLLVGRPAESAESYMLSNILLKVSD